jgi:hypothetical protein
MLSDIVKLSSIGISALCAYSLYAFSQSFIDTRAEVLGEHLVSANDQLDECNEPEVVPYATLKRVHGRFLDDCVAEAKNNFPVLADTRADRAMVYEFLCKLMKNRGLRPTHIQENVYGMVNRVIVPNRYAITAEQVMASTAVRCRTELSGRRWRSVFRPFGRDMRPTST